MGIAKRELETCAAPNEKQELKVGHVFEDGWILTGVSPDTGYPFSRQPDEEISLEPTNLSRPLAKLNLRQVFDGARDRFPNLAEARMLMANRAFAAHVGVSEVRQLWTGELDMLKGMVKRKLFIFLQPDVKQLKHRRSGSGVGLRLV
ncbi:MAG: hypothetical protein GC137_04640 [Alphaproteobacteria bacterium]|nr:hypothetical protein [Alphaproteobacteria bacterium]